MNKEGDDCLFKKKKDNAHTVPQRALDFRLGLGGLNQAYWPNCPTPSKI